MTETRFNDDTVRRRYQLLAGDEEVGWVDYDPIGSASILIKHTEVRPDLEGQGLGSQLLERVLAHIREQGRTVVPICPYALAYIRSHPPAPCAGAGRSAPYALTLHGGGRQCCITPERSDTMVLELAEITIRPGEQAQFDAAIASGIETVISRATGFRRASVHKGIESLERYVLQIEWDTLENHTVDFRGSPAFTEWRAIVGPFFAQPPRVEHFTAVAAA